MARTKAERQKGTAYHEAGHVIASYLLGRGVVEVSMVDGEETAGFVRNYPRRGWGDRLEDADYQASWGGFTDGRLRRAVEIDIMISLAGGMTQERFTGVPEHETGSGIVKLTEEHAQALSAKHGGKWEKLITRGDWASVLQLARKVSGGDDEAGAYVAWLHERTRNLISEPRFEPAVRALADALLEHRVLTGREAKQIVQDAIERWQQPLLTRFEERVRTASVPR